MKHWMSQKRKLWQIEYIVVFWGKGKWVLFLTGLESEGKSLSTWPWLLKIVGDCNWSWPSSSWPQLLLLVCEFQLPTVDGCDKAGKLSWVYNCLDKGSDRRAWRQFRSFLKNKIKRFRKVQQNFTFFLPKINGIFIV